MRISDWSSDVCSSDLALGASYGGFMINWIAGNWNAPWKCLVMHDGIFDNRSWGYATEELWFSEWENGGTPFAEPKAYEKFNPARFVDQWRVPIDRKSTRLNSRHQLPTPFPAFY